MAKRKKFCGNARMCSMFAYHRHPERFVRSAPKPPALPSEVWINKPISTPEPRLWEEAEAINYQQRSTLEEGNALKKAKRYL